MFDDCTSGAKELTSEEMAAVWQSDAFATCDGVLDKYERLQVENYKGLDVTLYPAQMKLRVQGSFAIFANGNNVQLLTYSELVRTIPLLAAAVGLPTSRLQVIGLELSLDLDSTTSPQPFLETLQQHKNSRFNAIKQRKGVARPLQFVASHANYDVKLYNKGAWAKQQGNPLPAGQHKARFEVVFTRGRNINALWNRPETTLADLTSLAFYVAAAAHLEQKWKEVVRTKPLDFTGLKTTDRLLLGAGSNPEFWRGLKADRAPITYKRTRKRYRELVEDSAKRVGPDAYDLQVAAALAAVLSRITAAQNDTFLHTYSQVELPPLKEREEAPALHRRAEGLLVALPSPHPLDEGESAPAQREEPERCCKSCGQALAPERKPSTKYCDKKCRNAASNPAHNARRALLKIESQPLLFSVREFVRVPEQYRAFVLAAA